MANETGRKMTETGRDDVRAKEQLACYPSLGLCWSPVMWTEGSDGQDHMAWQRSRGNCMQKFCFASDLDVLFESRIADPQQVRRYMKDQQALAKK